MFLSVASYVIPPASNWDIDVAVASRGITRGRTEESEAGHSESLSQDRLVLPEFRQRFFTVHSVDARNASATYDSAIMRK